MKISDLKKYLQILEDRGITEIKTLNAEVMDDNHPWEYLKGDGFYFAVPTKDNKIGKPLLTLSKDERFENPHT